MGNFWQVGKKLKFDLADINLEEWLNDLKKDKDALIDLLNNASAVTADRDAKLSVDVWDNRWI
ncbi:MAG: hypothetical protein HY934_02840 [Candidatus Firestonebacteria bacterium]|nr:hypothetical protein [Candidatus Firestonebacteria bacterium]